MSCRSSVSFTHLGYAPSGDRGWSCPGANALRPTGVITVRIQVGRPAGHNVGSVISGPPAGLLYIATRATRAAGSTHDRLIFRHCMGGEHGASEHSQRMNVPAATAANSTVRYAMDRWNRRIVTRPLAPPASASLTSV